MQKEPINELITPETERDKIIKVVNKIIKKFKPDPDEEVRKLVDRTLTRLLRQKREDGEI